MRGGFYNYANGSPNVQSYFSDYWLRRTYTISGGYLLGFQSDGINSQGNYNRSGGLTLRCLALASNATKGEPVAAIEGILRVDEVGVEVQVVATRGASQSTRPVEPAARLTV